MAKGKGQDTTGFDTSSPRSSALVAATSGDEAAALAALAEAGLGDDGADGLSEVVPSDLRTPLKLYNVKKFEGATGRVTQDSFVDTVDRSVSSELHLVLLELHKSNRYTVFNKKEDRNITMCSSYDCRTGTYEAANPPYTRPCAGCPDAQWRTDEEGKRTKPCSEVWTVAAFDLVNLRPCFIKFKSTALDCIKTHLQMHHIGKRPLPGGKRGNIPLFAFKVKVGIVMHKSNNYAVPTLERGEPLQAADLRAMADTAAAIRDTFQARLQQADREAGDGGGEGSAPEGGGDTSFEPSTFEGSGQQRGAEAFVT